MKSRFTKTILLAAVIVGGIWVLSNRDQIREPRDVVNLIQEKLSATPIGFGNQADDLPGGKLNAAVNQPPALITNVVRIASFKLNERITGRQSGEGIELLADICRRYDAIAFQEIDGSDNSWLARLTDRMNAMGAIGTLNVNVGAGSPKNKTDYFHVSQRSQDLGTSTQSAIVFNRRTLDLDPLHYTLNDPDNILSREPLVALFRARGTKSSENAFTFTMVNVKIDGQRPDVELAYLGELFRAIRDDGRGEDDVLIVGDFHAGDQELQPMRKRAGLTWVVSNRPTNTLNTSQFDNLVFNEVATVEFTGRGGVFDFLRHYNLRLDDALRISEHMPVWAEFSIFEGARPAQADSPRVPGRVAEGGSSTSR